MGKITTLSPEIVAKIAAGEVIERPSYALKELIENSLDAGATLIKIQIEESGLKKIRIEDNGEGMDKEDLLFSVKPHSTSKISIEDDLVGIKTLGFRGEALSSIAAISDLTIQSKTEKQKLGGQIEINHGKFVKQTSVGMPRGTVVTIANLFTSVPVRKKFLKSPSTEFRHILDVVIQFCLSHPKVGFTLTRDKKKILEIFPSHNLEERINIILGNETFNQLIPIKFEESYIRINGYISRPQLNASTSKKNIVFVNKRRIFDNLVISALKESYSNLLDKDSFPISVLFISLPFDLVDANVHPQKEKVNFINSQYIFDMISKATLETLTTNNLTFTNVSWKNNLTKSYAANLLRKTVISKDDQILGRIKKNSDVIQIHNLYLATETTNGIMFFDQHAVHEAILFKKLVKEFKEQKNLSQKYILKKKLELKLNESEKELLLENIKQLEKLGFAINKHRNKTFQVVEVPSLFKDRDIQKLIVELLEDLENNNSISAVDKKSNKMLSYLACRSAIKAGEKLNKKQCKKLINSLEESDMTYTCPHGRPVKIELSLSQLHKLFKRE